MGFAEEKILYLRPEQEKDRTHFIDKDSGVELELVDSQLFLDWLAHNYKQFGATLEIITDRSQEGAQFVKGFGGIGGLLRYQVDFQASGQTIAYFIIVPEYHSRTEICLQIDRRLFKFGLFD